MWFIMDSFWQDQASEVLHRLRQNLPVAILTTVTVSLIIGLRQEAATLAQAAARIRGTGQGAAVPRASRRRRGPHHTMPKFHHGFTVDMGWRGAVIDAGVVQRELDPRRYRRRAVAKMIAKLGLGENAQVIVWRDKDFPVILFRQGPVCLRSSADAAGHPLDLPDQPGPPAEIVPGGNLASAAGDRRQDFRRDSAPGPATGLDHGGGGFLPQSDRCPLDRNGRGWIQNALEGSAFELVRITDLRIFSPALDRIYQRIRRPGAR